MSEKERHHASPRLVIVKKFAGIFVLVSRNVSRDIHYTRKVMMGTLNTTRKIGSPTKYKLKIRSK